MLGHKGECSPPRAARVEKLPGECPGEMLPTEDTTGRTAGWESCTVESGKWGVGMCEPQRVSQAEPRSLGGPQTGLAPIPTVPEAGRPRSGCTDRFLEKACSHRAWGFFLGGS